MSRARFFLDSELPDGEQVVLPLSAADLHHALRVARVKPGEELDVVTPAGSVAHVRVDAAASDGVVVEVLGVRRSAPELDVTLFQGLAKGEKMDAIVRQAVEVGASAVIPVVTARSVVRVDASGRARKGERWRRVAKAAAEQARRSVVPPVSDPIPFDDAVEALAGFDVVFVAWETQRDRPLSAEARRLIDSPQVRCAVVVGPEGGLSAEEVASLEAVGSHVVSLGESIMRTETAAVVALSLVAAALQEARIPRDA